MPPITGLAIRTGVTESKSVALPLGYSPLIKLRAVEGIEPSSVGTTIRCVNHFATTAMAGTVGIEPTSKVLETSILPLNYVPKLRWWRGRFELPNPKERIYSPPRLATSLPLHEMVPARGLEPQPTDYKSVALPIELGRHNKMVQDRVELPTHGASIHCSTN